MTAPQVMNLTFSTEDLPARDRISIWREVYARTIVKADTRPTVEGPFRCDARLCALPGLGIASMAISPSHVRRTRELIAADGNDDFVFVVSTDGTAVVSQVDREVTVGTGAAVLLSGAEAGDIAFHSTQRFLAFTIPAPALASMIPNRAAALMRPVAADAGALRMLIGYAALLQQGHALASPDLQGHAATHVCDLVALAIGTTRDATHVAAGRGARAARLVAIRKDVLANLSQVRLSPAMIARRHGVTERYVHRLFAGADQTFGEFVSTARLERARNLLLAPAHADKTIGDIAHSVGYGEISTFNRAFRRRFGDTPSALRSGTRRMDA